MAHGRGKTKKKGHKDETARFLRFGAIPLMVIIMIIVIMTADHQKQDDPSVRQESSSETGQTEDTNSKTTDAEEEGESRQEENETNEIPEDSLNMTDPDNYPLLQDTMMELTGLIQMYCDAKKECDPELLAQVFGISDWTDEQKNEERERMELLKASIKSYENISCYWIQGMEEDGYVIFPYYEIRYRETETLMPSISWGYVRKDESGQYYIVRETDEVTNNYIRRAGEKPEVKAVMASVQAQQQEAIASDEVLQRIYGSNTGSEVVIGGNAQ